MKKNKSKAGGTAEKEFVFEFRAGKHSCVLKVPLQFPVQENINDLHGRLMLLHKIPCYIENGEIAALGKRKYILGQFIELVLVVFLLTLSNILISVLYILGNLLFLFCDWQTLTTHHCNHGNISI